jgi:N-hydroxyarylamine O-acetyltransferase
MIDFDLDAYCARIGYDGDLRPTLQTLHALHLAHTCAIPFENLDPLAGVTPELDMASLEKKLIHHRRGGYCFEHNLLFRHALQRVGFRVTALAGRVLWNAPSDSVGFRSHMLLRVDLPAGPFIADAGFGSLTLTAPLRLVTGVAQSTPHESFRLVTVDGVTYRLEAQLGHQWKALYQFDLQEQYLIDYEVANWYLSTHARSRFVNNLVAARADTDRRYALLNAEFAVHHRNGWTDRRALTSVADLKDLLTGPLAVALPDYPKLDAILARAVATGRAAAIAQTTDSLR